MPENAPYAKIMATKGYGAEVILYGKTLMRVWKKHWRYREART
jgi:Threonine dehydratase